MKNYQDFLTINYNKELIPGLFEMELEGEGARFITCLLYTSDAADE